MCILGGNQTKVFHASDLRPATLTTRCSENGVEFNIPLRHAFLPLEQDLRLLPSVDVQTERGFPS